MGGGSLRLVLVSCFVRAVFPSKRSDCYFWPVILLLHTIARFMAPVKAAEQTLGLAKTQTDNESNLYGSLLFLASPLQTYAHQPQGLLG